MATSVPLVAQDAAVARPELTNTADHEVEDSDVAAPIATVDQNDTLAGNDRRSLDPLGGPGMPSREFEEMVPGEQCPRLYRLLPLLMVLRQFPH